MNVFTCVTWKSMLKNRTRTLVTIVGVILSAALFTAVITTVVSAITFMVDGVIYENGDYYTSFFIMSDEETEKFLNEPEVKHIKELEIADFQGLGYVCLANEQMNYGNMLLAAGNETFMEKMPVHLLEGRLPKSSGEIVITEWSAWALNEHGKPSKIGDTVTFDVTTYYQVFEDSVLDYYHVEPRDFSVTYTIVGIVECSGITGEETVRLNPVLTLADGNQGAAMWHNQYYKTAVINDSLSLSMYADERNGHDSYGLDMRQNVDLLILNGWGKSVVTVESGGKIHIEPINYLNAIVNNDFTAPDAMILIGVGLCLVIVLGSVSLIHNVFSISMSERTKQFGLLASIGATKKQIRKSALAEAGIICVIGVPPGLILGWVGTAAILKFASPYMDDLFAFSTGGAVTLKPLVSVPVMLTAAIVAVLTVYVSAWRPAENAAKVTPMESIRQTGDYTVRGKDMKKSGFASKMWGLPGMMAEKYYSVSRKKYRATVTSLTVSVVLIIVAVSLSNALRIGLRDRMNIEDFDLVIHGDAKELEQIRGLDYVEKSAYVSEGSQYIAAIPDSLYGAEYLEMQRDRYADRTDRMRNYKHFEFYYVEDEVFLEYLQEHGIDPEPYFDKEQPMVLFCNLSGTYAKRDSNGDWQLYSYDDLEVLKDGIDALALYPNSLPNSIRPVGDFHSSTYHRLTPDGELLYEYEAAEAVSYDGTVELADPVYYLARAEEMTEEGTVFRFYEYNISTGAVSDTPAGERTEQIPGFHIGARIDDPPFGISRFDTTHSQGNSIAAILPLSLLTKRDIDLAVKVRNYAAYSQLLAYLEAVDAVGYPDYLADEINILGLINSINMFSYLFVVFIALISAANVFNTISTNIALRRRDFGILKSVGMDDKQMYRMLNCECIVYGTRSLLFGLDIGLSVSFVIHLLTQGRFKTPYAPPFGAVIFSIASIFAVVFISMLYAARKLKKDDPIEAIRAENL